jgi:hypothetical protein
MVAGSLPVLFSVFNVFAVTGKISAYRSGQVRFITRPKSRTMSSESRKPEAAFATSEVTSLESNYTRIVRDDAAEPTTNVAENHNDVLQAATLFIMIIRGSPRDHFFNCTLLARAGTFSQAFETTPCQIKLAKAIKVLDRRYVTDQCSSVVAGPLQARPILIMILAQAQFAAQTTRLISLPSSNVRV